MGAVITYQETRPTFNDTINITLQKILQTASGGGSGGSVGSGSILRYTTTGPTADGVAPSNLNSEAIAVKPGGATYTWNSTTHVWDDV